MIQENLKQRLLVLRGTLRNACTLDGAGRLVLAAVLCILLGIALDYFFFRIDREAASAFTINTFFRSLMLVGFIGTLGTIAYYRIFAPLSVPLSVDDMALAVEKEFPQLNDSLISSVQLTRIMADDRSVSATMIEEVARAAYQQSAALDFGKVVKFERIKPVLFSAGGALAVFAILWVTPLQPFMSVGMLRLVNPFSKHPYPVRTFISVSLDDGKSHEKIVPRNDSTSIVAEVRGTLPSKAYIIFDHGKGWGKEEPITTVRSRTDEKTGEKIKEFQYDYNPVISSFRFIIRAGDNETDSYAIRAVDRPEVVNMQVVYELPKYISDEPAEPKRERSLRNVAGTRARLTAQFNKPLKEARITLGKDKPLDMLPNLDRTTFATTITLDDSKDYEITVLDDDGLDNKHNRIRHKIWVLPDALPRISWKQPGKDLEVSPTATVALALAAEDDWGLKKSGIKFKRYRGAAPAAGNNVPGARNEAPALIDPSNPAVEGGFDLPEPTPGAFNRRAQKLDLEKDWSLADMGLEPGDIVEYWAEAYDYCPTVRKGGEPQVYRLRVLSPEEIRRMLDIERLRLIEDLKVIIRDQENDKKQVDAIKEHLGFGNPFETSDRAKVSEAGALQEEIRRKTHNLQNAFDSLIARYVSNGLDTPDDKDRLSAIRDVLETEHTVKMPDASKQISSSAMAKLDGDRMANLRAASTKQEEILNDLKALLDQMQKWAETEDLLRMTRELLIKQRNVTRLTDEFKDRLGSKKPSDASDEEKGQVKALEHEQRDCANDMQALFLRMTQALAKMMELDKWVAKNIDDSIKIAQNTDATPENPDLATTGDAHPGIEDKMRAAQSDIRETFAFGSAGSKQRAAETGLERIILVLTRRREVDKELMKEIDQASRELRKILDKQRELIKQTDNINSKQQLQQNIAQARQQLQDIRARQEKLFKETQNPQQEGDPQAASFDAAIDKAREDLDKLIKDQNKVFQDTVDALSPAEREIARSIHELEMLEVEQRGLAKESEQFKQNSILKVLREHYEKFKTLRVSQEELRAKATAADKDADKARGETALKALQDPQARLRRDTQAALQALQPAADALLKDTPKDAPQAPAAAAAARALAQAASLALHAPDEMQKAAEKLSDARGKDALVALLDSTEKIARAEEVLLKALGFENKRFEDGLVDIANRQADTRGKLDEVANRVANLIRAGNTPELVAKDPKLETASKSAAKAMPDLEAGSHEMSDAADSLRQAAPRGDPAGTDKASKMQAGAADKIGKAKAALQNLSDELAKDKSAAHGKTGAAQADARSKAGALQAQIDKLAKDIENAHAKASGSPAKPGDVSAAAQKVGEAVKNMDDAASDLKKPNPAAATKNESKAIDALEDAKAKLGDLKRKVDELKTPERRLERTQKDLKDQARKLASDIKGLEDQLPQNPSDSKPSEDVKKASNNMQNAQNSLGQSGDSKSAQGGDGKPGESKPGENKPGDAKSGEAGEHQKDAAKEQERALSELDKAMKALDELAGKAAKEEDPREKSVLDRLKKPQTALRDEVLKLQKKLDQFRDKTGNKNADKASQANQSAGKNQSSASSQMGQGNQSGAKSSEEEAEQDLQDALDNLEQFQQQMAQQNRNEQLFQIEQELKKMMGIQKDILNKTQEVEKQRPAPADPLPRRAKLMVKSVFGEQQKLSDATKVVVKKLEEAPVFQWVLQDTSNDMVEASTRLDKEDSGAMTQEIQDDVIKKLGDLIEALRKERTKPQQQQGGGGGGGGGGKQPLVPPLAELKMLRIMQRHVNGQTKKIDEEVAKSENKELTKDQKDRLRRAAVKEAEISRVTKKIADELDTGAPAIPPLGPPQPGPDGN